MKTEINCSVDFILDSIRQLNASDRYFNSSMIKKTCSTVEGLMREVGMSDIKTLLYPADGKTEFGGWVMPIAWDVDEATLELVSPDSKEKLLCKYSDCPCSLMLNSRPIDITAEVVLPDAPSLKGKFVLNTDKYLTMQPALEWLSLGAVGILSSGLGGTFYGKPGYEYLNDACQWYNYIIPHWTLDENPVGFSLTPRQGKLLRGMIEKGRKVVVHADVKTRIYDGTIPMVTGLLKGESEEEVVITGHLFEYGANDNASGISLALGVIKEIAKLKPKRSIRLMCAYEVRSMQAFLNNPHMSLRNMVAGVDIDMVGVSLDKNVWTGGSRPFFPSFAEAFLSHIILSRPGYSIREDMVNNFEPMDNLFCDPQIGVPFTNCVMITSEPNYHKSTDTPDRISRDDIQASSEIISDYISFLCFCGLSDTYKLADIVLKDEIRRIEAVPLAQRSFALSQAFQVLDSIKILLKGPDDRKKLSIRLRKMKNNLRKHYNAPAADMAPAHADSLRKIFPKKNFGGVLSFENYVSRKDVLAPAMRSLIHPWSADIWITFLLMWSNGKRSAEEIYVLISQHYGEKIDEDLFMTVLEFLEKENRIIVKRI